MDENNKYCACTGTDAKFHITLNQQGPEGKQGPQGIKGVDGISPSISVESSTQNNYQLRISTAYNTFVTPNLKGDDKVQIDPFTLTKPGDIPEFGLNKTVTNNDIIDGIVTIPGGLGFSININDYADESHSIKPQYRFPITTTIKQYGIIIGKSTSYLLTNNSITANNPIMLTRNKDGSVTLDFDDTNYQGKLTAGNNIDITDNTISVTGMPTKISDLTNDAGYLTTIPSEYVTDSELEAKGYATNAELSTVAEEVVTVQSDVADLDSTVSTLKPIVEDHTIAIGSINDSIGMINTDITELKSGKQDTLTAGTNITIEGNVISGTGGVQIDDETPSTETVYSSNKVEDLLMDYIPTSTYTEGINQLENTKNQNIFDINKFTVVGSPTITDDGVATNFSNSSYIRTQNNFSIDISKNFEVHLKLKNIKYNSSLSDTGVLRFITETGNVRFTLRYNGKTFYLVSGGNDNNSEITGIKYFQYTSDMDVEIIFGLKDTTFYGKIKRSYDTDWSNLTTTTITIDDTFKSAYIEFSRGWNNYMTTETGSIDLKQFSITVDGKVVFSGLMESTKPIYDNITSINTQLSEFELDTNNNFSAVNSALNEKANLSDLSGYVTLTKYNELLDRVVALETEINGGNA